MSKLRQLLAVRNELLWEVGQEIKGSAYELGAVMSQFQTNQKELRAEDEELGKKLQAFIDEIETVITKHKLDLLVEQTDQPIDFTK